MSATVTTSQGECACKVTRCPEEGDKVKPSNRGAFVWDANVRPCHLDSSQAAAAISRRDAVSRTVKCPSSSVLARRSHSYACAKSVHF